MTNAKKMRNSVALAVTTAMLVVGGAFFIANVVDSIMPRYAETGQIVIESETTDFVYETAVAESLDASSTYFHIPHIPAGERVLVGRVDDFEDGQRIELHAEALEGYGLFIGLSDTPYLSSYGEMLGTWVPFSNSRDTGYVSTRGGFTPNFVYLYIGASGSGTGLTDITARVSK